MYLTTFIAYASLRFITVFQLRLFFHCQFDQRIYNLSLLHYMHGLTLSSPHCQKSETMPGASHGRRVREDE